MNSLCIPSTRAAPIEQKSFAADRSDRPAAAALSARAERDDRRASYTQLQRVTERFFFFSTQLYAQVYDSADSGRNDV